MLDYEIEVFTKNIQKHLQYANVQWIQPQNKFVIRAMFAKPDGKNEIMTYSYMPDPHADMEQLIFFADRIAEEMKRWIFNTDPTVEFWEGHYGQPESFERGYSA